MMEGSPGPVLTSISISLASTPTTAAEKTRVIMEGSSTHSTGVASCKQGDANFEKNVNARLVGFVK